MKRIKRHLLFSFFIFLVGCSINATVPSEITKGKKFPLKIAVILPATMEWDYSAYGDWKGIVELKGGVPERIGNNRGYYREGQEFGQSIVKIFKDGLPFIFEQVDFYPVGQAPPGYALSLQLGYIKAQSKIKEIANFSTHPISGNPVEGIQSDISVHLEWSILDKNAKMIYQGNTMGEQHRKAMGNKSVYTDPLVGDMFGDGYNSDKARAIQDVFKKLVADLREGGFKNRLDELKAGQ